MKTTYYFKNALLFLLLATALTGLNAQNYVVYQGNGKYTELTNPIVVTNELERLDYRLKFNGVVSNDFDLKLFGKDIDTDSVIVGRQGFVLMVTKDGNNVMAIDPFVAENVTKYDETSQISHKIETVNGLRYYVVQWKNIQTSDAPGKYVNLQMWLEEGGENVKFHFGPTDIFPTATSLNGIQCGIYQLTTNFQVQKFTNLTGTADEPAASSVNYGKLSTFPQEEMVYTFATGNPTGVSETNSSFELSLFPNPVSDKLTINVSQDKLNKPIAIYTLSGQAVFTGRITKSTTEVDFSQLEKGLYLVRIGEGTEQQMYKVIK